MYINCLSNTLCNHSKNNGFNKCKLKPQTVCAGNTGICGDLFVKPSDVNFKGFTGGTLGAVSGELLALGVTKWLAVGGVFWPVAIFCLGVVGFGAMGDLIEEKIDKHKEENKENSTINRVG